MKITEARLIELYRTMPYSSIRTLLNHTTVGRHPTHEHREREEHLLELQP